MADRSAPMRGTLPCPFCGASGDHSLAVEVDDNVWTVICQACGANGPLDMAKANTASRAAAASDWRNDTRLDPLGEALNSGDGSYRP